MMKDRTPKTPASNRSIVRNHSPYCESTGPIVQEGFVAARIRALQGFSNQAQITTRSHSPLTPCPSRWLDAYKSRSAPRPSLASRPVLIGTDMPGTGTGEHFHTNILSKDHRNLVSASVRSTGSSDVAPSLHSRERQASLDSTTPSRLYIRNRGAEYPSPNLFADTVSSHVQSNQDHIKVPTPCDSPPEIDQVDNGLVETSSPSEIAILSPHAIQPDLVEPRATWKCLPQTEDCNYDYSDEQASKPGASIADKLGSMVERGWVGGDTFREFYDDDESSSHTTESKSHIRNTRIHSGSDCLSEMPRVKEVLSCSGSLSVSTAEMRSESQHSTGEETPPHSKQKEPRTFVYRDSQKQRQLQAKRSPAVNRTQRSTSYSGVPYLKAVLAPAPPTGKRRAWTLHHLGRSTSMYGQISRESSPTIWPSCARDHHSSEQDHESMKSPSAPEGSTSKPGFNLDILKDEQHRRISAAISKVAGSRHSSSNTKGSTRSTSRSTSLFKKFPWYKVALVDKQSVVQDLSKAGRGNDRTSRSTRDAQHDPNSNQIELPRGVSRSHTVVECGHEDENASKMKTPANQVSKDQQAVDAMASFYKESSQLSLQRMTSPQKMNQRQVLEQNQSVPERPQDSQATRLKTTEEWLLRYPHQVVADVIGRAQSPIRTDPSGTQPSVPSQSGSMDASFEPPIPGDVLRSLQPQWSEVKKRSPMQSYPTSYANSTELRGDDIPEQGSSGSGTARPDQELTASPTSSHPLRSKVVNLSPKHLGTGTDSSPASVRRSDQDGAERREVRGRGKGIKRIQVIVAFDGADDLVIEATLKKKDRREHWRTLG